MLYLNVMGTFREQDYQGSKNIRKKFFQTMAWSYSCIPLINITGEIESNFTDKGENESIQQGAT